jgi:hypothetical protein
MRRIATLAIFLGFLTPLLASAPAHAQASRTWVSGVGDDANPCSRTAPCKTFAGAISKTATGGEINCLDPGGFGAVTITKSITIDCHEIYGSVLVSGTNGINIAASGGNVVLRNLNINGLVNNGLKGVSITTANNVWIEDCTIFGFLNQGIVDTRSTGGSLNVSNTTTRNNGQAGVATATTGGTLKVNIDNLRSENNQSGVALSTNTNGVITRSVLSSNTTSGYEGDGANTAIDGSSLSNNATGVLNQTSGTTRLSNNEIMHNATNGINNASGTVFTYGNNRNNTTTAGTVTAAGAATPALGQQ